MSRELAWRAAARVVTVVLTGMLLACAGFAQERTQAVKGPDPVAVAREIMQAARYCTLVTLDEDSNPQARMMDPFAPDADLTVWMATNPKSRKVAQIGKHPRVALHYFDPASMGTVALFGEARLVNDPAEKKARWKDDWKDFYPDRDASYLLILVRPERLEVMSPGHGLNNDPVTWKPVTVELRKNRNQSSVPAVSGQRDRRRL